MDNFIWQAAVNLKRFIEGSGRAPTLKHYATVLWLKAQEDGQDLEAVVRELILASEFERSKLDLKATLKVLGF